MDVVILQDYHVTNRELSRWLAEGNGEMIIDSPFGNDFDVVCNGHSYMISEENDFVYYDCRIRKWSDTDWHGLSRDYMELRH